MIDSLANGGAERSLAAMVPGFAAKGLDLEVAVLWHRPGVHEHVAAQVPVHVLAGSGRGERAAAVRSLVREVRPDVVHSTLFEADLAVRLGVPLRGPAIVTSLVNDSYGPEHRASSDVAAWKLEAARLVDAVSARRVRRFHAISRHVATQVGQRLRLPPSRVEVIPRARSEDELGVRTAERRAAARRAIGIDDARPLVLAAARQERQKGLDVLLEAVVPLRHACPDVEVMVAGRTGAASAALRARAREVGVRLLGDRDDVADLLCGADAFASPSRWEGAGSVLIEALALGCPIVASDLPAVVETVGDAAVLVPADDPAALATALATTLLERAAAGAQAQRGRRRYLERFTVAPVVSSLAALYGRAVGR